MSISNHEFNNKSNNTSAIAYKNITECYKNLYF